MSLVVPERMILADTWVLILINTGLLQYPTTSMGKAMWYGKLEEEKERKKRGKKVGLRGIER